MKANRSDRPASENAIGRPVKRIKIVDRKKTIATRSPVLSIEAGSARSPRTGSWLFGRPERAAPRFGLVAGEHEDASRQHRQRLQGHEQAEDEKNALQEEHAGHSV